MLQVVPPDDKPVRFKLAPFVSHNDRVPVNTAWAESAEIPLALPMPAHKRSLAIVGGGPSVERRLKDLRRWKGDIWAVNDAVGYLADRGIPSVLISVDAYPSPNLHRWSKGTSALLAACCDPSLFQAYEGRAKRFYVYPSTQAPFIIQGGPTTACRIPDLALKLGYRKATFFGCEGSYGEASHVYDVERGGTGGGGKYELLIKAGEHFYQTNPGFLLQAEHLSGLLDYVPEAFDEVSGGLLRAMRKHKDWTTVGINQAFRDTLV